MRANCRPLVTRLDITDEDEHINFATIEEGILFVNVRADNESRLELKKIETKASLRNYLQINLPGLF